MSYDRWKTTPPEGPEYPPAIEDYLGARLVWEQEPVVVESAYYEDDEDEDGKHRDWYFECAYIARKGSVTIRDQDMQDLDPADIVPPDAEIDEFMAVWEEAQ